MTQGQLQECLTAITHQHSQDRLPFPHVPANKPNLLPNEKLCMKLGWLPEDWRILLAEMRTPLQYTIASTANSEWRVVCFIWKNKNGTQSMNEPSIKLDSENVA